MNIHEYQAKEIFRKYGVPTPRGGVAFSGPEARKVAEELGGNLWVVKAQIHAGGRGKAGGVKLAKTLDEVEKIAEEMLGMTLVTHQTGPEGKVVKKVYIEEGADIKAEYYLGMVLDRALEMPVMMASTEGGMEIEEVAEKTPEKIVKVAIDPTIGFQPFHARKLAFGLGLGKDEQKEFIKFATALYNVYMDNDAEMIEINPLIKTGDGRFLALDAKMGFDDNALYRHPEIAEMRDLDEEEPTEIEAKKYGLSYIKLDGNVGCMVNGAGLAMATMDIIKHEGGEPANFLDVGGGANPDTVAKGFEIILSDPNVKSIFVNIFGGIVRCDRIANGILQATEKVEVNVPVIVRLDGTNAEEAAEILRNANIKNIIPATDLKDGAQKAVKAAKGEL
ncbi:ADP-forming succinate--CoA ligase subunit beta [Caminibacter pacificus]|jgi:succinyl-CoA synthetase beta subunit|uniref:Succinate--CoA ligase [ADP-forming] subunit beta n=1 Tax=Caminibacter pacificus TaxID=1424653 RepID=A0AAJ4RE85_9BACT|nr:ADP-forming succinate--CoA ligase subunit beta [Caminibacter pacificus]QCI28188.1 ADP-forming succinate--CoA ligase subunit beta [Caminibacter pacificus]ROR41098.1 succinyl-CoA synthetase beta subunit [Caminibacter pacificus]